MSVVGKQMAGADGFDRLAPFYDLLAGLAYWGEIGRCRRALLDELPTAESIVILGAGTGDCVVELGERFPEARLTVVDWSGRMLDRTRRKVARSGLRSDVTYIQGDLRVIALPSADLVAAHCVFDCFDGNDLQVVLRRLSDCLVEGGALHWSDFRNGDGATAWWRSGIVRGTYWFFVAFGALRHDRLVDPCAGLLQLGFAEIADSSRLGGLLTSRICVKSSTTPSMSKE